MSLPSRSGPSKVRAVAGMLAAMGCTAAALTPSPSLAQAQTTFSNGNPIYTPGQASTAPPGRR